MTSGLVNPDSEPLPSIHLIIGFNWRVYPLAMSRPSVRNHPSSDTQCPRVLQLGAEFLLLDHAVEEEG